MSWTDEAGKAIAAATSFVQKSVDDSLRYNAENASGAGLEVRVTRTYDGVGLSSGRVCQWCKDRECNEVTYEKALEIGAFQRHEGCECVIEYVSKRGIRTYQSGKSGPKDWLSEEEFRRRAEYGLDKRKVTPAERAINAAIEMQVRDRKSLTLVDAIIENHEALRHYTPEGMKRRLERAGYNVTPLKKGRLNNKPFEEGGGFIVNFGGDGALQYHPEKYSHHGGAYWKVKNGITGKNGTHYDLAGNPIKLKKSS